MTMRIGVDKTERGWELIYSFNGSPFCVGPEEESVVYNTRAEAEEARQRALGEMRAWERSGLADAPHMDA